MSTPAEVRLARRVLRHELEAIRGNWGWLLALGIVLIVIGTIAVGMPLAASVASAVAFGALFLVGGIAQLVGAFWTREWSGFFLSLLMGVIYVVLGLMFLRHPGEALMAMSLFLACALMVSGLFRIIGSLFYQFPQWGWTLARRRDQPGAGALHLQPLAARQLHHHRPVRGDRHDLHRLDLGRAGTGREEAGPPAHRGRLHAEPGELIVDLQPDVSFYQRPNNILAFTLSIRLVCDIQLWSWPGASQ